MKSLIIGMGIGQLYKDVLTNLGHSVVTVDSDSTKNANFASVEDALGSGPFDTVHICTPNFTHQSIAETVAPYAKIVFIEKPGLKTSEAWSKLVADFPATRFMMVKNNEWRSNIADLKKLAATATAIDFNWINFDRIPSPGSWFTTKEKAFGGVRRDLLPHLLSLFIAITPNWASSDQRRGISNRRWSLSDVTSSDYGTVDPNGTYDVDDECMLEFELDNKRYTFTADWRSLKEDKIDITFYHGENTTVIPLGLCPEEAYQSMIQDAVANLTNQEFWSNQYKQDMWIHDRIQL